MARNYTDAERQEIFEHSRELLSRDVTDVGRPEISEPELTPDEIRQLAFERPLETRNQRDRREITERNAQWAAKREADRMENLEARLARERDAIYRAVAEVFAQFCGPYEEKLTELRAEIVNSRGRDGVSVVGAALNHRNELMLTLSDGSILTPGRVDGPRDEVEPIEVPPVLRRVR